MLGAGLSSQSGVIGQISLRERNFDIGNPPSSLKDLFGGNAFRGGGQELVLRLSLGSEQSAFRVSFFDPSIGHSAHSFGTDIFSTITSWEEFDLNRTGGKLLFGKKTGRHITRQLEVGYENIDVEDMEDDAPPEIQRDDDDFQRPYVSVTVKKDTRNRGLQPSEGYMASLTGEVAFSDIEIVKLIGEYKHYWTTRVLENERKHILQMRARAGVIDSYSDERIPVFERFYAGGIDSLRGFERWGVSPVEPVDEEQIGGESLLTGSLEYSVPGFSENLRLAAFVDAGYVEEEAEDLLNGWDKLRLSTGAGIRWLVPALGGMPIHVDVAVPLMEEEEDETETVHFTLGVGHAF
jgi:outer membrane protein insertion porin family